jgi:hypothetical protein
MIVTREDRIFYATAMEYMIDKLEVNQSFAHFNGFASFPADEMSDLMISGIKDWLTSPVGEQWLGSMGYVRAQDDTILTLSGSLCPVCSGSYLPVEGIICERCGKPVCNPCINIVDHHYHIGWCDCCVQDEALTNLLSYNEEFSEWR